MADKISVERRSANMRAIKSQGTKPEVFVRKLLHSLGYRFRLHRKDLPGKPDIVFASRRAIVEVRGCFWHQHQDSNCSDARAPKSNPTYWSEKLRKNVQRDERNLVLLQEAGWRVMIVWDCDLKDPALPDRLAAFLGPPGRLHPRAT